MRYTVEVLPPKAKRLTNGRVVVIKHSGLGGDSILIEVPVTDPGRVSLGGIPEGCVPQHELEACDADFFSVLVIWKNELGTRQEKIELRPVRQS